MTLVVANSELAYFGFVVAEALESSVNPKRLSVCSAVVVRLNTEVGGCSDIVAAAVGEQLSIEY